MASTYTLNTGIEKPGTGEQSGTWGNTTNTNFDIIDRALSGVGAITLTGTSHTLTTTDGSLTDGMYKVLVLGGSPSGTNTITIGDNTQDKVYFVVNNSGQEVIFTQGTGANATIANGAADIIYADGAGSGAAVASFFGTALKIGTDVTIGDDLTLKSDSAVLGFGADTDTTLTHTDGSGLTLNSTNKLMFNDATQFIQGASGTVLDIAATDEIELTATLIDVVGNLAGSGTGTFGGILKTDDTTEATSTTDGSLQTDGGLSIAKDAVFGNDVKLLSDSAVLSFGADGDVTLTHVHDTGLLLNTNLNVTRSDNGDNLTLISTDADAGGGPALSFYRNSSSPADDDTMCTIRFEGNNDNSQLVIYGKIRADIADASDGTEDGTIHIFNMMAGTERAMLSIKPTEVVFNEESQDVDFRVEGDTFNHLFMVDASSDCLGVGIATPTFATGRGVHLADDFYLGFGNGNGTRPDFQLGYTSSDTRLDLRCGFGSDTADIIITSSGFVGLGGTLGTARFFVTHDATGTQTAVFKNSNSSVATEVQNTFATRAGNSAYSLIKAHSNDNGDVEFNFRGDGNAFADGSFSGGGADYAEFFEWKDGNSSSEDRVGYSVILDENKIVKASNTDDTSKIIGVISGSPAVIGDGDVERWKQKYLRDDYGREVWEEYTVTEWTENGKEVWYETDKIPEDVTVPSDKKVITTEVDGVTKLKRRKLNPSWDKSKTYISREDRKEWGMVGLMGKLRLRKGQPTGDRWIKMRDISDTVEEWLVR
jgi:hypothetical protein